MHWRNLFFVDYHQLHNPSVLLKIAWFVSSLGHEWVVVFFVLSGYLVGGSVLRSRSQGTWNWPDYLRARFTRLYIVLIPALVLGALFDFAGIHQSGSQALYAGQSGIETLQANVHQTLTFPALTGNLLYLQDLKGWGRFFHIPTFGSNGPLWSLSIEFWCYLAFPPLVIACAKSQRWPIRILCASIFCAIATLVGLPCAALCVAWLFGVLITRLPRYRPRQPWLRYLAIIAALCLFLGALILGKAISLPSSVIELFLALAVTVFIWTLLHCTAAPGLKLFVQISQHSARSAYTLYLVHLPVLVFLKAWLHLPQAYPEWRALPLPLVILLAVLLYAQAVYFCFEKQTGRLRNWLRTGRVSYP